MLFVILYHYSTCKSVWIVTRDEKWIYYKNQKEENYGQIQDAFQYHSLNRICSYDGIQLEYAGNLSYLLGITVLNQWLIWMVHLKRKRLGKENEQWFCWMRIPLAVDVML